MPTSQITDLKSDVLTGSAAKSVAVVGDRRLPYQLHQRVEFLHLQAETEALLQKLYLAQHRRNLCESRSALASV